MKANIALCLGLACFFIMLMLKANEFIACSWWWCFLPLIWVVGVFITEPYKD